MSLRDELRSIYEAHGTLTPRLVVDEARDPSHPLHSRLEWDNTVAGEKYREQQAAELIRSVKVVFKKKRVGDPDVREFLHVERPEGDSYVPVDVVAQDPFTTALVLRQAEREWKAMKRRYQGLAGFLDMVRGDIAETG